MGSAIDFFKNEIKDNNYIGFELVKHIEPACEDDVFHSKSRYKENYRKSGISDFLKNLSYFISMQDISHYITQITFDEEFDANLDQKIFEISGHSFENLKIFTGNIVGSIIYENKSFNINCRFGNEFLQYMIASSSGFLELEKLGNIDKNIGLGEWILIYFWKMQLKKAFALGMYKTYQKKSDSSSIVRGSIDINKYLKKTFFDGKVDCKYKEHSYNNIINKIISLALIKVFKGKYISIVEDIYEIKNAFDYINTRKINFKIETDHKILNPFYAKYNEVYQLSLKILNNNFASVGNSNQNFSAFLFDISLLFEHHVRKLLQRKFTLLEKNKKEIFIPNGIYENKIYPDVIIDHGNNKISIYDVKYKHFNNQYGVDRNDRFQLISYVSTYLSKYDVVECGFIYPSNNDFKPQNLQYLNICTKEIPFKIYLYKVSQEVEIMFKNEQHVLDAIFLENFNIQ